MLALQAFGVGLLKVEVCVAIYRNWRRQWLVVCKMRHPIMLIDEILLSFFSKNRRYDVARL